MGKKIRICFGGDVCGIFGLEVLQKNLPSLIESKEVDFVVINGENTLNGAGIREEEAKLFFDCGVDVITGGNHTLEKFDIRDSFGSNPRILRPHNYPFAGGSGVFKVNKNGTEYAVINLQGREGMRAIDCPFQNADTVLNQLSCESSDTVILVDFHAESSAEKEALGFFLDGRVTFVGGTHTHIQTADNKILPKGTGYITDVGMIGAYESVIGGLPEVSVKRVLTQVPQKMDTAYGGKFIFSCVIIEADTETKKTLSCERIRLVG